MYQCPFIYLIMKTVFEILINVQNFFITAKGKIKKTKLKRNKLSLSWIVHEVIELEASAVDPR